jgi:ribosomal protein L44E
LRENLSPGRNPELFYVHPARLRGALMRRLERGAGRKVDRRFGPKAFRQPAPGNSGPWLVRRPRARFAPSHSGGVGAPPGDTTIPCQELADVAGLRSRRTDADALQTKQQPAQGPTENRSVHESAARRRSENAAAGRREARRPASWAGHLRRSGDGSARETDHRVRRFRTSACRRSAPLIFWGAENGRGHPPPANRVAERWLF